jgi:hypothetical protein
MVVNQNSLRKLLSSKIRVLAGSGFVLAGLILGIMIFSNHFQTHEKTLGMESGRKAIKAYNEEILPLYRQKSQVLGYLASYQKQPDRKVVLEQIHAKLKLVDSWKAKSADDVLQMEEIMSYLDTDWSSLVAQMSDSEIKLVARSLQALERNINTQQRKFKTQYPNLSPHPSSRGIQI